MSIHDQQHEHPIGGSQVSISLCLSLVRTSPSSHWFLDGVGTRGRERSMRKMAGERATLPGRINGADFELMPFIHRFINDAIYSQVYNCCYFFFDVIYSQVYN